METERVGQKGGYMQAAIGRIRAKVTGVAGGDSGDHVTLTLAATFGRSSMNLS
jgi:hypothetical protein